MSRPRALVAEDELPQRRRLCELLGELWPELEVIAECGDGLAALEALTAQRPDVAFLDIRMPGLTGLEVARAAGATQVVFTTAYEAHALDAFDHAAVDYLLKPIRRDRLGQSIVRLKQRLAEPAPSLSRTFGISAGIRWITGSAGHVTRVLGIDEVLFFAAQDKYVRVVTADDEVQIRTPLRELLAALDPEAFWQIHRSVIVRAGAIHRIESGADGRLRLTVKGRTEELPVSQAFQFRFRPM
ncbi:MAG TPA: LytTR family DNA-binding domain-containing protein [Steroidobacteraceae bacterium]|nr:LytTR family DNA-binding domain-containing protein [Steroidobacteraceae bacterium]